MRASSSIVVRRRARSRVIDGQTMSCGLLTGEAPYHRAVTSYPDGFDVEGPVQAEVFVVWLAGDHLELTGPCGAAPWLIELGATDHPVEVVARIVRDVIGEPLLVHSTSWRRERDAVILSFVVIIDGALVGSMDSLPIARSDLARGAASAAPREISTTQVVEHGLRHMAWLAHDDPVVAAELPAGWRTLLAAYVPEPFRNLG
jgi:hypothetical protein